MDKSINISDRDFHSWITRKYQKGRKNPYDFPLMIFFKNTGQLLSQKINLDVLLQFNISKNITTQHISKSVEGIKNLLEWFRIERSIPNQPKGSSKVYASKDIHVYTSFAFQKISSAFNRMIYPQMIVSEKSYFKSPLQQFNQIQQFDHIQNYVKKIKENQLNQVEDISSIDTSVSWDYKFVFNNEFPVILQHVNLLLRNSKLASSPNYPDILNDSRKSTKNKSNAYFGNDIQIINYGSHPGFEPVILPHVNLLLNNMSIQGDSNIKGFFKFSQLDNKYHVILPHVNLLLNKITEYNMIPYKQGFSRGPAPAGTTQRSVAIYKNFIQSQIHGSFLISGHRSPMILAHVNISNKTTTGDGFASYQNGFDYSFPQAGSMYQEFAGNKKIHFTNIQLSNIQLSNVQLSNDKIKNIQFENNQKQKIHNQNIADHYRLVYNFPSVLQHIDIIQKNLPEMILSHANSFPTTIKHDMEKDYQKTLSYIIPSVIKTVLIDDFPGQTIGDMEHIKKPDALTENHDLHFKTNRKIEEEIENVKRIAHEAKQTVIESVKHIQTSREEELNWKININQLSDQVYRLLDRKITIEKERRGYI